MSNAARLALLVSLVMLATTARADKPYPADTVVAKRGDAIITMLDVDAALQGVPERLRANVMNNPKRIEELLERLLINRQVALEGHARHLDEGAEFKQAVKQQEERLLSEQRLLELRSDLDLGDVEELANERYQVNPDAYAVPGLTSARHILVATKDRSDAEARKIADEVHAKAVAGEDFIALVKQYSDDPSKVSNQGLIPSADSDSMDPAFANAVKQLAKPGDISPVIKSSFGYHVIVLDQRTPPKPRSFEEVRSQIVSEIENTMREARVKEHVDELKSMKLEAVPEVVASLRTRYLPENAPTKTSAQGKQ